ncbi:MAG: DUF2851 family protein, partial [Chlorobi bacterium]|nr:DUF2851 family protein [Chlorobiota bacterium]
MFFRESFLHFVWQHRLLDQSKLHTTEGEPVEILSPGFRNPSAGPDFWDARLRIGGQLWAGHVEVHLRASDWYAHHHERDPAYNAVILHVVWEDDMPVFNAAGAPVPALELKDKVLPGVRDNYVQLASAASPLKCAPFLPIPGAEWEKWTERLYVDRLEDKARRTETLLRETVNDWEEVLFRRMLRYFGMVRNTEAFERVAERIGFRVFRKYLHDLPTLEALLLGTAGLLPA